ncbi:MAG TPA: hypothetical protein PK504_08300 [Ferruginibacter sp.]|nr:hypothetical protein [Ferruginibacter sp.]HRE64878.1 hypothetical protein [Ferruginibacter sp.]
MNKILLTVALLLLMANVSAQPKGNNSPEIFMGEWKGILTWVRQDKEKKEFSMRLMVAKIDSANHFSWTIEYGDGSSDTRPYTLKPVDASKGYWVIDEHNGIVLDNYMLENCLQGSFTVMGKTITNSFCVENGQLKVEFFAMNMAEKKTSGKGTTESPVVDSYQMTGYQYGWLSKVN